MASTLVITRRNSKRSPRSSRSNSETSASELASLGTRIGATFTTSVMDNSMRQDHLPSGLPAGGKRIRAAGVEGGATSER